MTLNVRTLLVIAALVCAILSLFVATSLPLLVIAVILLAIALLVG